MLPVEATKLITGERIKTIIKINNSISINEKDIKTDQNTITIKTSSKSENFKNHNIFNTDSTNNYIFDLILEKYIKVYTEGFNINILFIGSSQSNKSRLIEGIKNEEGLIELFIDELLNKMENKKNKYNNMSYSLRFGAVEICDENVTDLFGGPGCKIEEGEWAGPKVTGAIEYSIKNYKNFRQIFANAKIQRTKFVSEFGPLVHKATGVYFFELVQVIDNIVFISKINFIEIPAIELLLQDQEQIEMKEGTRLNKGIFAFGDVLQSLGGKNLGDICFYEKSLLTSLLKDALGGNSHTLSFFSLSQGDSLGSISSLRVMTMMKRIKNFPVLNEGNLLGLLRRYRIDIIKSRNFSGKEFAEKNDELALQFMDLEKKVVEDNLMKIKKIDNDGRLAERLGELKEKYNRMIRLKRELHGELIKSEEEKLQISKALVESQLEKTKLMEELENRNFNSKNKLVGQEAEIINLRCKQEKALETVKEIQEKFEVALEDKKDIETELLVIRTNYSDLVEKNENLEIRIQSIQVELINITNEKKELEKDFFSSSDKNKITSHKFIEIERKYNIIQNEYDKTREALLEYKGEIERLKVELSQERLKKDKYLIEMENKQLEIQKKYYDFSQNKHKEIQNLNLEFQQNRTEKEKYEIIKESEKRETLSKNKQLLRKLNEVNINYEKLKEKFEEIKNENLKLTLQNDEMRNIYRSKLMTYIQDGKKNFMNAREDILRNYAEREGELMEKLNIFNIKNKKINTEIAALRKYSKELRYLAEDWAPLGKPLPNILLKGPPIVLDVYNEKMRKNDNSDLELKRSKKRILRLEEEINMLQQQIYYGNDKENNLFSQNSKTISKFEKLNGDKNYENENKNLKRKILDLKEENNSLTLLARGKNNDLLIDLKEENYNLKNKLEKYQKMKFNNNNNGNNDTKFIYYEKIIESLEIERSQLLSRATLAEEKMKQIEQNHKIMLKESKIKIRKLKNKLGFN